MHFLPSDLKTAAQKGQEVLVEALKENKEVILNIIPAGVAHRYEKTDNLSENFLKAAEPKLQGRDHPTTIATPVVISMICKEMEKNGYTVTRTDTTLKFSR